MAQKHRLGSMDAAHARRVAVAAQGLGPTVRPAIAGVVARTGLVRTLGGAEAYLAIRARVPGTARAELDAAVQTQTLRVLPAARGCIYLVPGSMNADVLRFAERHSRARSIREHEKAGIRAGELETLADAVVELLGADGALTTQAIRKALPEGAVRALGETGKKVGISSTLPPALRLLEFSGRIERTLEGGRLDTERYLWRVPPESPFAGTVPCEDAELDARLGDVFFRAAGISTLRRFAAWLGISQRNARAAVARLPLIPVRVAGWQDDGYVHETHRDLIDHAPDPQSVALLPFEDNLIALCGGPASLVASDYHDLEVPVWGRGSGSTLGDVRHASIRTIACRDRIVGVWELDPDTGKVVWGTFGAAARRDRCRIEAAAEDASRFLVEELGHGRTFSIDNETRMRRRVHYVRGLAAG